MTKRYKCINPSCSHLFKTKKVRKEHEGSYYNHQDDLIDETVDGNVNEINGEDIDNKHLDFMKHKTNMILKMMENLRNP